MDSLGWVVQFAELLFCLFSAPADIYRPVKCESRFAEEPGPNIIIAGTCYNSVTQEFILKGTVFTSSD